MNRCALIKLIRPSSGNALARVDGRSSHRRSNVGAAVQVSIFCQRVDITKLLLYLLDALDAAGMCVSVAVGDHDRPSGTARYNRHFD
jgi:hypothetical protein